MRKKEVMIVTGAGQISMAIARRVGYGKKIVMGDKNIKNAKAIAEIMNNAGFDVEPVEIKMLVNGAGVSPSQAPIEAIIPFMHTRWQNAAMKSVSWRSQ